MTRIQLTFVVELGALEEGVAMAIHLQEIARDESKSLKSSYTQRRPASNEIWEAIKLSLLSPKYDLRTFHLEKMLKYGN